jgi:hypothetical protein
MISGTYDPVAKRFVSFGEASRFVFAAFGLVEARNDMNRKADVAIQGHVVAL